MPDVNILYIIIAILLGYILFNKRKLSIPFDNYNCKETYHSHSKGFKKAIGTWQGELITEDMSKDKLLEIIESLTDDKCNV